MASWLRKLGRAASKVAKLPGVSMIPGVGAAASVLDLGLGVASMASGGGGGSAQSAAFPALPMLPAMPQGSQVPAMSFGAPAAAGAFGTQVMARAGMAAPQLTIDLINQLKAAGLITGFSDLLTYRRSPRKDQVVVHWPGGGTVGLNKKLAKAWGLWKPGKKPVISVGESEAVNKAGRVVKKFAAFEKKVKKVANFRASKPKARQIIIEQPGKRVIGRKVA